MILLTTHLNADFDCIGAMVGIRKLNPEAQIVFPGSKEPSVREFLKSGSYDLQEKRLKHIDLSKVRKIIIVDTQNIERLGAITDLIRTRKNVEVELIDHHPRTCGLQTVTRSVILPVGSTTTIVIKMLKEEKVPIEPDEATVMALGVYEDTGFLLFPTTTAEDLLAVSYLLEYGADLRVVSSTLKRGLSSEQIVLYNDFITSARSYHIRGEEVTIAMARSDKYIPDAAIVVHQYCESENVPLFYALIEMADRILFIGRSRLPTLNAGKVAEAFGGGGHASASSATLKDMTLLEAKEKLLEVIGRYVTPAIRARDIMSKVIFTAPASISVEQSLEHMNKSRVNALPLTEGKRVVGAITRQIADRAIFHGMGKASAREVMLASPEILPQDADLSEVQKIMIEKSLRFVLIGEGPAQVRGIITRMALFRNLYEEQMRKSSADGRKTGIFTENIQAMMEKRLPKDITHLLRKAGRIARTMGTNAFLVGGMVRDLILDEENLDIDIVVEGNGIEYAKKLARYLKSKVKAHTKFQTAVIELGSHRKIDVASARTEYYEYPAALPTVERGILRQDLYRRDFTINTLAINLTDNSFGTLVDYFGGRKDLKEGKIRVLHSLSFVEDPTRAYRAVRFSVRLGFVIAKDTQHLIQVASEKGIFDRLSGRRITKELKLIFQDQHPVKAIRMMDSFGLIRQISTKINLTQSAFSLLERIDEALSWHRLLYLTEKPKNWMIYLLGICDGVDEEERTKIAERLNLTSKERQILVRYKLKIYRMVSAVQKKRMKMSDLFFACRDLPLEIILFTIARTRREELKKSLTKYLLKYRNMKIDLSGDDLKALGLKPGPAFSDLLDMTLRAKIDGKVKERKDELRFVRKMIQKRQTT